MNAAPASPRRSPLSLVVGMLMMAGSLCALGAIVVSDVAAAETPPKAESAPVKQEQVVASVETPAVQAESSEAVPELEQAPMPEPEQKPMKKKRNRKVDFGRFEGY